MSSDHTSIRHKSITNPNPPQITGRPLFVLDTYRRFLYDWGHKMKGIPSERYQMAVDDTVKRLGLKSVHAVSGYRVGRVLMLI